VTNMLACAEVAGKVSNASFRIPTIFKKHAAQQFNAVRDIMPVYSEKRTKHIHLRKIQSYLMI
jgi:hypothetical protein